MALVHLLQVTVDAAQQETQGKQATVNADYLNIRSGKGTDTSIIGGLTQGSVVTILDNSDANWVKSEPRAVLKATWQENT